MNVIFNDDHITLRDPSVERQNLIKEDRSLSTGNENFVLIHLKMSKIAEQLILCVLLYKVATLTGRVIVTEK